MNTDQTVENFHNLIEAVIGLIRSGDDEQARTLFNQELFPKYNTLVHDDERFRNLFFLYGEMDKFLNSPSAKIIGMIDRDTVLGTYDSDYMSLKK
jgi:hypothetical protein